MNTMNSTLPAGPRRVRGVGATALLVAVAAVLAGCSAAGSDNANPGGDKAYQDAAAPGINQGTDAGGAPQLSTADRSVIVTGSMYMTVKDPIVAADRAVGIVQNAGGRIDARDETAPDGNYGGSASLTLRIPSDDLDTVVNHLRELGTVDQFSTTSVDVTNEVTDLDIQISTLRASTTRIEALIADAKDISDIITLENELDSRQAQLQSLEAQQRGLNDQVSMSTITLSLTTEPVVIVDDSPQNFWDALSSGWNALVGFLSGALVVVGVALPWIGLLAVIAIPVIIRVRSRKSRAASKKSGPAKTSPAKTRVAKK